MRCRARDQTGSVAVLVVVMIPVLLLMFGLVYDGGRQLQARRNADAWAGAAARAAVQPAPGEITGGLDSQAARSRAAAEVAGKRGVTSHSVSISGDRVTVTVSVSVDYAVFPGGASVTGHATADPQEGVQGDGR